MGCVHTTRQIEREQQSFRWVFLYGSTGRIRRVNRLSIEAPFRQLSKAAVTDERPEKVHKKTHFTAPDVEFLTVDFRLETPI